MEPVIGHVDHEQVCDIPTHRKSDHGDHGVDDAEQHQVPAGGQLTGCVCEQPDESAHEVHDVVRRIHLEDEEHAGGEESCDAGDGESETEDACEWFDEEIHGERGKGSNGGSIPLQGY